MKETNTQMHKCGMKFAIGHVGNVGKYENSEKITKEKLRQATGKNNIKKQNKKNFLFHIKCFNNTCLPYRTNDVRSRHICAYYT